jgi:hypothetical protein
VLLDGQHRRKAREEAGETAIRVRAVEGTHEDALHWLGRENGHEALPLSGLERRNYAWRLVRETRLSRRDIVLAAKVSDGIVAEMRRVAKAFATVSDLQAAPCGEWSRDRLGPGAAPAPARSEEWNDEERTAVRDEIVTILRAAPAIRRASRVDEEVLFNALGIAFGTYFIGKLAEFHLGEETDHGAVETEHPDDDDDCT